MAEFNYVTLERRFIDIGNVVDPDDDHTASLRSYVRGKPQGDTWSGILENDATIILGTAGSGKSTEVLEQARRLRENGIPACVLRLEALCRQPVRQSYSPKDPEGERAFGKWLRTNKPAILFLDALDEARSPDARNGSVLNDAFAHLWETVGNVARELKLVITTRPSEWHGPPDLEIVKQFVRRLRADQKVESKPKAGVYRIASLQHLDVERIAASRLPDTAEFLQAVAKAWAGTLASQPFEVHILIDAWKFALSQGVAPQEVFASRLDLFEASVSDCRQTKTRSDVPTSIQPEPGKRAKNLLLRWCCLASRT